MYTLGVIEHVPDFVRGLVVGLIIGFAIGRVFRKKRPIAGTVQFTPINQNLENQNANSNSNN